LNSLVKKIAGECETILKNFPHKPLPPMRELATHFAVSVSTVHKAIQELKLLGVVEVYQGGRVRARNTPQPPLVHTEPAETPHPLLELIKQRIKNETYQRGHMLPKVSYLAVTERVSHHTVTAAYRLLAEENIVHKRGKSWYAGPRVRSHLHRVQTQPVIIILQTHESFWSTIAKRPFYESFCRSFQGEVENHHIKLQPVVTTQPIGSISVFPSGPENILSFIRKLQNRYLGCLIINSKSEIPDLASWILRLQQFNRPVVWFDRLKENPQLPKKRRNFFRCHESERRAIHHALEALFELGHRRIGMPMVVDAEWLKRRAELIEGQIQSVDGSMQFYRDAVDLNPFLHDEPENAARYIETIYNLKIPFLNQAISQLLAQFSHYFAQLPDRVKSNYIKNRFLGVATLLCNLCRDLELSNQLFPSTAHTPWFLILTPSLLPLIKNEVTAIIAPNDVTAHYIYLWLQAMQIVIPRDISLISFDNHWFLQDLPITSVDFGYGYLGFAAFHTIVGDVDISKGPANAIAAQPRVVHRGTINTPRSSSLAHTIRHFTQL